MGLKVYKECCKNCLLSEDRIVSSKRAKVNLIVAAPELLDALKVCYKSLCTYGSHPIIEKQVENALRKAEGVQHSI